MSEHRAVSVVIPHYGDPSDTLSLVGQLLEQKSSTVARIIVADDHSPIPFPADAFTDSRLVVSRKAHNGGFGSAVNHGLSFAQTPWALVLNSDAQISSRQIEALVDSANSWAPAVVSPKVVGFDGESQWTARLFPTVFHQVIEWLTPLARFRHKPLLHRWVGHDTDAESASAPTPTEWVFGAVMLLPVAAVRRAGGFDESYFMNAEEVDLQRRLRESSIPSVMIPTVEVLHEGGGSSASQLRRTWLVQARDHYAQKWGHPRLLRGGLYLASAVNFGVNLVREAFGRDVSATTVYNYEWGLVRNSGRNRDG